MSTEDQAVGLVVASHGRHYAVALDGGGQRQCYTRGKKSGPAVGDRVTIRLEGDQEGVIIGIAPRRNLLYRSDATRSKQFAANLDQLLIVLAPEPEFSDDLTGRALVAAWSAGIEPVILLNKADLTAALARAQARLQPLVDLGVRVVTLSALDSGEVHHLLDPMLRNRRSLLLGQSGMGKSTLLNALAPDAGAATQAHSDALGTGRHTTTNTRLYTLPNGGELIDSPGFQAFGLQHLSAHDIEQGFPEFAPAIAHCRFYNCTHRHEPGCGVLEGVAHGGISPARHALYQRILEENEAAQRY
ncbi:ribosome small subunit-dependent GTPase A [Castellaniella sp. GW247-6E4]|uniref:ribosome small subunit-dependent GTPase A n=1 Tax=Castellaniella sp. GW247-6E4 TaxID=3140380 RepID=UPI0033154E32